MTLDLMVADCPLFLGEPTAFRPGCYTDEGVRDGHHGVKLATGKWLSLQPGGSCEERDEAQGPYEWFTLDETVNVLRCTPRNVTYAIAVREP